MVPTVPTPMTHTMMYMWEGESQTIPAYIKHNMYQLSHLLLLSPDGLLCPSQLSFLPRQLLSIHLLLSLTGLQLLL